MSVALFLIIFSLASCSYALCPPGVGWQQSAIDKNKCYLEVTSRKSWFEADSFCRNSAYNGQLVSISSAFETLNINSIVNGTQEMCNQMWIGARDIDNNGQFTWSDGRPFQYTNWQTGQPVTGQSHCVSSQIGPPGSWRTTNCSTQYCFICENYGTVIRQFPLQF